MVFPSGEMAGLRVHKGVSCATRLEKRSRNTPAKNILIEFMIVEIILGNNDLVVCFRDKSNEFEVRMHIL